MAAEIQSDKELEAERIVWIDRGQITQQTGRRASGRVGTT